MGVPVAFLALAMEIAAPARPPRILQIYRERLKPGAEAAYRPIEEETARAAVELGCPHPYLAAERVGGAKEIWWFNGFDSTEDRSRVSDGYASNLPWTTALERNSKRKASLTLPPIEAVARYREDLSSGPPWALGDGRFLVVTVTKEDRRIAGTVFEAPDGTRFVVIPARTRREADASRARAGSDSYVLAVRPSLSFPAREWIVADPAFWRGSSSGKRDPTPRR
jgi:hypothetical protein